ncbi:MAG: hypothetical protein WDW38_008591 [Sanguina aurantia]
MPVVRAHASATHVAQLIDGKKIAEDIRKEIAAEVVLLKASTGVTPGLAVVLVGSRKDSETYVRSKKKGCAEAGIESYGTDLPETATEEEVLKVVAAYNADPNVHGILVQLPLPKHISETRILDAISIEKDVDGFHPLNMGALAMRGREPLFVPCTPRASAKASYITPVPGGVGPMTIAILLKNTLDGAKRDGAKRVAALKQ